MNHSPYSQFESYFVPLPLIFNFSPELYPVTSHFNREYPKKSAKIVPFLEGYIEGDEAE